MEHSVLWLYLHSEVLAHIKPIKETYVNMFLMLASWKATTWHAKMFMHLWDNWHFLRSPDWYLTLNNKYNGYAKLVSHQNKTKQKTQSPMVMYGNLAVGGGVRSVNLLLLLPVLDCKNRGVVKHQKGCHAWLVDWSSFMGHRMCRSLQCMPKDQSVNK